ncbi:hypothetical protein R0D08_32890, partial [Pseudomonas aeruginosa]|uniref:hypothetical protein n=1 Tax=Pseudomonas aeruginosa TaxID=287 RepID=UPI0029367C5F
CRIESLSEQWLTFQMNEFSPYLGMTRCGMQIKFHPNGNDLLGWLGSSLPDLYLKSHPNASQRPSNGRKTPEPCE